MTIKETLLNAAEIVEARDKEVASKLRASAENPKDGDAEQFVRLYLQIKESPLHHFSWLL